MHHMFSPVWSMLWSWRSQAPSSQPVTGAQMAVVSTQPAPALQGTEWRKVVPACVTLDLRDQAAC